MEVVDLRFKTNFFVATYETKWELNVRKFHSFVISDLGMGNGRWRWGEFQRFLVRISLALALPATTYNT